MSLLFGLIPQNLTPTRDNNHRYDELTAEKNKIFFLGVALLAVFHSLSSRRHGEWRWTIHNRLRLRLRLPKPILYGQSQTSAVRQIQLRSLDCWPVCWHNFLTTQVCMWRMWCAQSAHIPTPGPLCWMFFICRAHDWVPITWARASFASIFRVALWALFPSSPFRV